MIGIRLDERYELTAELGRGGMGVVYRARDPVLGREVAVKLISTHGLEPGAAERFQREARVVAKMDHPAIVPIHDFGQHEGTLFFVMPLLEGTLLRGLISEGPLGPEETLAIGVQVAEALDYSHRRQIVHRDVKPGNLMVSPGSGGPRVRVMDFGLARQARETRLTGTGDLPGTIAYLSPEQVTGAPVDGAADVYALGAVLYECLAGEPPFAGAVYSTLYRIVHEPPPRLRPQGIDVDPELEAIILRCLAKAPAERPRGAELAAALEELWEKLRLGLRPRPEGRAAPRLAGHQPPPELMVGREAERAELERRLSAAAHGECQFVLLSGEAGIGKTRLVEELEQMARDRKIRFLRSRFAGQERDFPYHGLCDLIRDYFRTAPSASAELPDLSDLAPELIALFPVLSEIRELRAAAEPAAGATLRRDLASARPADVFELLARTLSRLAGRRPLILVIGNLHLGRASIDALEYLAHRLAPTPTLIVGTYRPAALDPDHPLVRLGERFRGDPRFVELPLGPLRGAEFRRLAEVVVGSSQLRDKLVGKLWEATEGNPLFLRELTRSLVETGRLGRDPSGLWSWSGETAIAPEAVPETIRRAVEQRLERLSEPLGGILAVASVLGRSFDDGDLAGMLPETSEAELDEAIDELVGQGLLVEDRRSRSGRLTFASGVVRELVYDRLTRRKRRSLHRRHAEQLDERFAGRHERVYPQLVHHFAAGGVADKTADYALALARQSLDAWSPEDAIRACRTALELLSEESAVPPLRVGELVETLARAYRAQGDASRALAEAERAAAIYERAGQPDRAAPVALLAVETAWHGLRAEVARRWVERGARLARDGDADPVLRRILTFGATLANLRGEHQEARAYLHEAEQLAPPPAGPEEEEPIPVGGTLVAALPGPIATLDPGRSRSIEEMEVGATVFETLLGSDSEGNLVPALAQRWQSAPDGRRFTLTLQAGVRFSDGTPLTPQRVKASLERTARLRATNPLPLHSALVGCEALAAGRAEEIDGIKVTTGGGDRIVFHLTEPLPSFLTFLTDPRTAIAQPASGREGRGDPLGTGPFRVVSHRSARCVLERNPCWRGARPPLERIEFRAGLDAGAVAAGLRSDAIDLGRDLLPRDLDELMRDPRWRPGLVETTKRNVFFVLFNCFAPVTGKLRVRRALAGVVRVHDLVWRTLGRLAEPAVGLIPPGVLGHDPGRRLPPALTRDEARELLDAAEIDTPVRLNAAVHPLLRHRYAGLLEGLLAEWAAIGVDVTLATSDLDSFLARCSDSRGIDLWIGRWHGVVNDPDALTWELFHRRGQLRSYYSSAAADRLLTAARQESRSDGRQALYRQFEELLRDDGALVPLFHDVDYRVASPAVRGLRLDGTPPYVNYAQLGKEKALPAPPPRPAAGGELHVPLGVRPESPDPHAAMTAEELEALAVCFEPLTRVDEGAQIIPWLLASFEVLQGGKSYHLRLRSKVRFHDGRRLTARDVRYSFEHALRTPGSQYSQTALLPIRGARALRDGTAGDLAGLQILSARELRIELERPVSFFPALLTHPSLAVVPEGWREGAGSWRDGCVGTGPFRVVRFDPGQRLDLERNPHYWRPGFPKSDRLVFHFGVSPEEILEGFSAGRFSLVSDLRPADADALRRDPERVGEYREAPRLATALVALNAHRGPFADPGRRRALVHALDVERLLGDTLGHQLVACGLIPPGLLGHGPPRGLEAAEPGDPGALRGLAVKAVVHPAFHGRHAAAWKCLRGRLEELGLTLDLVGERSMIDGMRWIREGEVDVVVLRWIADYPDADGLVRTLLHSEEGLLGALCGSVEVDRLTDQGRAESDPSLRQPIYRRIEEAIAREALLIPLFHEQTCRFAAPGLHGLRIGCAAPEVRYEELFTSG